MNFDGFSAESFEQLIRALTLKIIGPGATIFGRGPDGGREATFNGEIPYPFPPARKWKGYGVIQAKFKEKKEGTKLDQAWASSQLVGELEKWKKSAKRSPKPQFFIYCTNVELSSGPNGGKAKAEALLSAHPNLHGFAIWDGNQLKAFIDGNSEIRQRFKCFFSSGDLLSQIANTINDIPDPESVLGSYICREILADEDAKLSQAGDRSEDRIRLAKVFVDLASSINPATENANDDDGPGSLHQLLRESSRKLDPLTISEQREFVDGATKSQKIHARYMFLGGPGSGKSTIGQFLAQIHRAALLNRRPSYRLEPKTRQIIAEIRERCESDAFEWPKTPRYPFRIDLNAFAKAIADETDSTSTLSAYIRRRISQDISITHNQLRKWIAAYPILLILDGLDEVPSSSNRRQVISSIQSFLNDAREAESDLMVVASSRPAGYAGEFEGDDVVQKYLIPMSRARALSCAKQYIDAKISLTGEQRAQEAMATITAAIAKPLIAKLMQSPLQVTFMVTVVAASGKPSESRWQLFNDYYRIIYERELHKAVRPFDKVLHERRQDIDSLHHTVGFILQCRAETSGNTQADMSIDEFESLVSKYLMENGLDEQELSKQKGMILGAANLRLVFLTSRSPGRLSFDVRSLQEYMAAASLTNTDSEKIMGNLRIIARSSYWRNTLLFAIGRFFVDPQLRSHRDKIMVLCDELNQSDTHGRALKMGSWLALEIMESGSVGDVPIITRTLAKCALCLLGTTSRSHDVSRRLAAIYDATMENEFRESISIWLGQSAVDRTSLAWILVLHLRKNGVYWAAEIAAQQWPDDISFAWQLLKVWAEHVDAYDYSDISTERIILDCDESRMFEHLLPRIGPMEISEWATAIVAAPENPGAGWLNSATLWLSGHRPRVVTIDIKNSDQKSGLSLSIIPLPTRHDVTFFQNALRISAEESAHELWLVLAAVAPYYIQPSAVTLAESVRRLGEMKLNDAISHFSPKFTWPLQCCVNLAVRSGQYAVIEEGIRASKFGNLSECRKVENRWTRDGITIAELSGRLFTEGPTICNGIVRASSQGVIVAPKLVLDDMLVELASAKDEGTNRILSFLFEYISSVTNRLSAFDPSVVFETVVKARDDWTSHSFLADESFAEIDSPEWFKFFDQLGNSTGLRFERYGWEIEGMDIDFYRRAFASNEGYLGIVRLVALICASGVQATWGISDSAAPLGIRDDFAIFPALIRMSDPSLSAAESQSIGEKLPVLLASKFVEDPLDVLVTCLENHAETIRTLGVILESVAGSIPETRIEIRRRCEELRLKMETSEPSGFNDAQLLILGLPRLSSGQDMD